MENKREQRAKEQKTLFVWRVSLQTKQVYFRNRRQRQTNNSFADRKNAERLPKGIVYTYAGSVVSKFS